MSTLPWFLYAGAFIVGLVYAVLASFERVYERITLPQIAYLLYLLICAVLTGNRGDLAATLVFLAVPAALFAWLTLRAEPGQSVSLQAEAQKELDLFRKVLAERPADVIALEGVGDLYAKVGEHELARRWYKKLSEVYAPNKAYERLRISLEEKISNIEINPIAGTDPLMPFFLRACPKCDSMAFRSQYSCQVCGEPFYADRWRWRAAVINRFLERHELVRVAVVSLVFLPFLFYCGSAAYFILLGVWALGLRTNAGQRREVQGERPGELPRFLFRTAIVAASLLGIMAFNQGLRPPGGLPGRKARATAPAQEASGAKPGPASIRPAMSPEVKVALIGALAKGDFDTAYPEGTPMRKAIEEMAAGNASPTLELAVSEAQASGILDKPYFKGVTLRKVLEEMSAGRTSPTLEKALDEAAAAGDLDVPFAGGVTLKQIFLEGKQGYPGPSIEKALTAAEANGDLDRIKLHGKSLREYRDEAKALSAQADEYASRSEAAQSEALGVDVSPNDPRAIVQEMIPLLSRPEYDAQIQAVQTLSDIRIAANAEAAIPYLEPLTKSQNGDVSEFAKLALQRIRHCQGSTLCQSKWRKR
ncbi:MAG: hypothetical protein WC943_14605 [Elusimicrobiota bacterium]